LSSGSSESSAAFAMQFPKSAEWALNSLDVLQLQEQANPK
jgi:hypothetical protein